jgi:cbb3-type cytochrome oxidase subunit 3
MRALGWMVALAAIGMVVYAIWKWRKRTREREQAAEERMMAFMAQARPAPPIAPAAAVPPDPSLPQQKLLLEAATKAGEAGEPALSIQLYARLLARYPQTAFAEQARAAVEMQKLKLAKR